jgi:hypothetical protein
MYYIINVEIVFRLQKFFSQNFSGNGKMQGTKRAASSAAYCISGHLNMGKRSGRQDNGYHEQRRLIEHQRRQQPG